MDNNFIKNNGHSSKSNKLTTFSLTDSKLMRLLFWYKQHKGEILPIHQQRISRLNLRLGTGDVTKMRFSEKNEWIDALRAAETTWRKYKKLEDKRQHPITKFFKHSPKYS